MTTSRRPEPDRSVTRRILLAYPFQRWTARIVRVAYYLLLAFMALAAFDALAMMASPDIEFGNAVSGIGELVLYGLLALGIRAWAVSIENRPGLTAPQPGWYPDPSGAPGQRYWDGQQWTAVAPRPNLSSEPRGGRGHAAQPVMTQPREPSADRPQ